jgi:hypothetical protein
LEEKRGKSLTNFEAGREGKENGVQFRRKARAGKG